LDGNYNQKLQMERKATVSHHAAAETAPPDRIHSWHLNRGWLGIGYHYVVLKSGTVVTGRPEEATGAHAGPLWNSRSIGICFEGNFEANRSMTDRQVEAGAWLINDIFRRHKINSLKRHKDVSATNCPGKYFRWSDLKQELNRLQKGEEKEEKQKKKTLKSREEGILEKAIVINSYADFPLAEPLAAKLGAGIFLRQTAESRTVGKKIIVVGGGEGNIKGNDYVNLSGKDRFETAQKVEKYLKSI